MLSFTELPFAFSPSSPMPLDLTGLQGGLMLSIDPWDFRHARFFGVSF